MNIEDAIAESRHLALKFLSTTGPMPSPQEIGRICVLLHHTLLWIQGNFQKNK